MFQFELLFRQLGHFVALGIEFLIEISDLLHQVFIVLFEGVQFFSHAIVMATCLHLNSLDFDCHILLRLLLKLFLLFE